MTNAPGKDAYPICGATWLLVYQQQKDPAKGKKLVEFLKWSMDEGRGNGQEFRLRATAGKCPATCREANRRDQILVNSAAMRLPYNV